MPMIHVHDRVVMSLPLLWPVATRPGSAGEGLEVISRAAKVLAAAARINHPLHFQPGTGHASGWSSPPDLLREDRWLRSRDGATLPESGMPAPQREARLPTPLRAHLKRS